MPNSLESELAKLAQEWSQIVADIAGISNVEAR